MMPTQRSAKADARISDDFADPHMLVTTLVYSEHTMPLIVSSQLMDAVAGIGRNPLSKHQIQPDYGDEQADAGRDCRTRLARPNF